MCMAAQVGNEQLVAVCIIVVAGQRLLVADEMESSVWPFRRMEAALNMRAVEVVVLDKYPIQPVQEKNHMLVIFVCIVNISQYKVALIPLKHV